MSEENKYILQVKDLHTSFATDAGEVRAVMVSPLIWNQERHWEL